MEEPEADYLDAWREATMGSVPRVRRPRLPRTEPDRRWSRSQNTTGDTGTPPVAAVSDALTRGVEAGYRVIDEYLRTGQELARGLSGGYGSGSGAGIAAGSLVDDFAALFSVWLELIAGLARDGIGGRPAGTRGMSREGQVSASLRTTTRADGVVSEVPEVHIKAAVGGTGVAAFALHERAGSGDLSASDLFPVEKGGKAVRGASVHGHPAGIATFAVVIPSDQAPGDYVGAVFSEENVAVAATIRLTVSDNGHGPA